MWLCSNFSVAIWGTAAEKNSYTLKAFKSIDHTRTTTTKNRTLQDAIDKIIFFWPIVMSQRALIPQPSLQHHCQNNIFTVSIMTHRRSKKNNWFQWNLQTEHFAKRDFQTRGESRRFLEQQMDSFLPERNTASGEASWGHLFLLQPQACGPLTHHQSFPLLRRDCTSTVIRGTNPTLLPQTTERTDSALKGQ